MTRIEWQGEDTSNNCHVCGIHFPRLYHHNSFSERAFRQGRIQIRHFNEPTSLPRSVIASLTLVFPKIQLIYHISAQEPTTSSLQLLRHIINYYSLSTQVVSTDRGPKEWPLASPRILRSTSSHKKQNGTRQGRRRVQRIRPHITVYNHGTVFL